MEVKACKDQGQQIKVFISYSYCSNENKRGVLSMDDKLNQDGISCTIDQSTKNNGDCHFAGLLKRFNNISFSIHLRMAMREKMP